MSAPPQARPEVSASSAIGVFDSGVGGLPVARAIMDQLPHESILYVGDTAHAPYGPRPIAQVRALALGIMDELVDAGVKALVIACNSASAAVLRPYVSERTYWIVRHHGLFQSYYYAHHTGGDRNARDAYRDHPWYQDTVDFCRRWDQSSFDPDYESLPLDFFEPMVRRVFGREPFSAGRE